MVGMRRPGLWLPCRIAGRGWSPVDEGDFYNLVKKTAQEAKQKAKAEAESAGARG